ncbi:DUF885 domain-containing protein [Allosphingosinicella indica]|uniref:Uncharacterized conserved protein, DUF885 familyt n=1 Tax=Allosphingosinicella indica TaxID=941907 RepID=A0A1X7FZK0_9SPHN|nr:DUF885 domain-containing protein [Allosphingosinicella indica]SMF61535.1 Uncharacterized conserved protein, DUF885 familyt [Allosphingosinicella indica]
MSLRLLLLAAAAPIALLSATAPAQQAAAPGATAAQPSAEDKKLTDLFKRSDEDSLKRNPISALFRGDMRYADRFGDYISDVYVAAEVAASRRDLAELKAIDRAKLSPVNQIAYDVFQIDTERGLRGSTGELLKLQQVRPLNHFYGFHMGYANLSSGEGAAPFKTVADYDNNLKRHAGFVKWVDGAIGRFREGMATGVFETKLTISNVIDQLDLQLAKPVEESTYYAPVKEFPKEIPAADQTRLTKAYRDATANQLYPALTRLRDFLKNDYLPKARDQVGLSSMKGGDVMYAYLIESNTTLPLKAEEVHQLGLKEVARIRGEMDAIRQQVGFKGDLQAFFEHLRTAPEFRPKSKEALRDGYYEIGKRVDLKVREQFSTIPRTRMEIRPVEPYREKTEAGGSYQDGTPDGSRPGVFYYNTYDLPSRNTYGMETLYLHEGIPGHHFQISLANENESLPAFMRYGGNTAFVEGWALYAETLGPELGMFTDPYQRFGHLDDEMLRAMRLVVDTGIHAKGWTRDQAINYMLSNSGMGKTDATAEVERYIAIPGQALAYKIGALTIQRLKAKAEAELGDRFDPREFHAEVLMTGALPMTVLEKKIDDWIAAKKRG